MKKKMIIAVALAMGMLSAGAVSASAAASCCTDGTSTDTQVVSRFTHEAADLTGAVKAKENQLRELYGYEGVDADRIDALEAEIMVLKGKIRVIADKFGIPACCIG